jgi:hypothetical protein
MKHIQCTFSGIKLPAPAVRAYFYIPKIDYGCATTFLIDTGSDRSCLHGPLAYKLNSKLVGGDVESCNGIGGSCDYFIEEGIIIFWGPDGESFEPVDSIKLGIQKISEKDLKNDEKMKLSSVLGRDILNRGNLTFNPSESIINFCLPDGIVKKASRNPA